MILRGYQERAITDTFNYLINQPSGKSPIVVLPTGAGKSLVVAGMCVAFHRDFAALKPRGIITVPSKELCQQNYEKIKAMVPPGVTVGIYCEGLKRKEPHADIVVASIKSVSKYPASLGYRSYWINDECHLVKPDGTGDYWRFYDKMVSVNAENKVSHCKIGLTATPFRGNGVWLTYGPKPMYHGIAHETGIADLLKMGFLSPLVNPQSKIETRVNTAGIKISGDDYNISELAERTKDYLLGAAQESVYFAKDRKKWMAFLPTVETAEDFSKILNSLGVSSAVVTGSTPDKERDFLIEQFKKGNLRCLVTVIALTTGFDVPDIDCIIWLRSTTSPVLYIQGAGRGTRIAEDKIDCLWLDFTDTTERLGAIDTIRGKTPSTRTKKNAPCIICDNCGEMWTPASKEVCVEYMRTSSGEYVKDNSGQRIKIAGCGFVMRTPDDLSKRTASEHEIMVANNPHPEFPITGMGAKGKVNKRGKKYISIEFYSGMNTICYLQIEFTMMALAPVSAKWWKELTGDHKLNYNNYTSCLNFITQQIGVNPTLGVTHIVVDRTHDIKFPRLKEIIR